MIPGISPPTDSLYKFISIFGLGILILGVINMTSQQDELINNKIAIENIQHHIYDTLLVYNVIDFEYQKEMQDNVVDFSRMDEAIIDLDKLEAIVSESTEIPQAIKAHIITKIDIIEIQIGVTHKLQRLNYYLISFSVVLIFIGFVMWYIKEQRWQDKRIKSEVKSITKKKE